jgi:RND family efflux transporter MFP subunit
MKCWIRRGVWVVVPLLALGTGYVVMTGGQRGSEAAAEEATSQPAAAEGPVAPVRTTPIVRGTIHQTLTAYGTVIAQPGAVRVVSVPFECRVAHVLVASGQQVSAGTTLVEVEASPDTQLQWEEVSHAVEAADKQLQQARQRFDQHLATNQELLQVQQEVASAQLKLKSLTKRGIGSPRRLLAELAGIVSTMDVREGQIVPAGGALVELAVDKQIEVKLGIEPEEVGRLKVGQPVSLIIAEDGSSVPIVGRLRMITQRVNAETRLVDAFVSLPAHTGLLLDQYVRGQLIIAAQEALIVPRQAVLPDDDGGYTLFTVDQDHALKHAVTLGLQNDKAVAVSGEHVKENQRAVIAGNYELENGMAVTEETAR